MAGCSIIIENQGHFDQEFILLQNMPNPSGVSSRDVYLNVYQKARASAGDRVEFAMGSNCFAIIGTCSSDLRPEARCTVSSTKNVRLGPGGSIVGLTMMDGNYPSWDRNAEGQDCYQEGAFTFRTNNSFQRPNQNHIIIGVGAPDPNGRVIPTQTWEPEPGTACQISPQKRFYVARGSFEPGTALNRDALGHCLQVDFSGAMMPQAEFSFDNSGQFRDQGGAAKNGVQWRFGDVRD